MTVQELINELLSICDERDPNTVEVKKVVQTPEGAWGFGDDWEDPCLDYAGGNAYPFVVLIK